jgi:hypothetical protein
MFKQLSDSPPMKFAMLKSDSRIPSPSTLPEQIFPKGLPLQRQWYLYDKIREYCSPETKDITCPLPSHPRPSTPSGTPRALSPILPSIATTVTTPTTCTPAPTSHLLRSVLEVQDQSSQPVPASSSTSSHLPVSMSNSRTCSKCGKKGHNKRTCNS